VRFARRMEHVRASGVREFFERGRRIGDAIDLSIGQPDFGVPEAVKRATIAAIEAGSGRYSPTQGMPELVEAVRDRLRRTHHLGDDEQVMMTVGATGGLHLAFTALAGEGDEVLLPDPGFVMYGEVIAIAGATPVHYDMYPDFHLRVDELAELITPRTRAIIVNTPANPTGVALDPAELARLADLCRERGIFAIADELYDAFSYDRPHAGLKPLLGDGCLLIGSFSKTHGMAGWRLGWAAGPAELIDAMMTLQQFTYTCPPTLVQMGALAALDVDLADIVAEYRTRRDLVVRRLGEAGYELARPTGSFFAFPKVPWGDDLTFCERALESSLILVPGRTFSRRHTHFRLCFAAPPDVLERGLDVLAELAWSGSRTATGSQEGAA